MRTGAVAALAVLCASSALAWRSSAVSAQSRVAVPSEAPVEGAQFANDARHTGRSSFRGPRREPSIQWRVRARRRVYSSPVLASSSAIAFAGVDGTVHAVDLEGIERWAFSAPGGVFATPAWTGSHAIVGHGGGAFVAIDARGERAWTVAVEEDADASPTLGPDHLALLANRGVIAVDARTGAQRWRTRGARILGGVALTSDGAVVYADVEGSLVWLRVSDGAELRRARVGALVEGSALVLDDNSVVVGAEDGHVRKFTAQGAIAWDVALGGPVRTTPALGRDGAIIVGSDDLHVHALDATTGARRWSVRTGGFIHASARIDRDGWIYVGSEDDRLLAIEPGGQLAWALSLGADIDSSALIVRDGAIAVGCDDGGLYLLSE
jgi:outer membrane protein assembly factor BamB